MSGAKSFCWPSSPSRYTTKAPALAGLGPFRITATEAGTTEVSDGSAKSTGYPNPFTMKLGGPDRPRADTAILQSRWPDPDRRPALGVL
jgi:hypothetical protein